MRTGEGGRGLWAGPRRGGAHDTIHPPVPADDVTGAPCSPSGAQRVPAVDHSGRPRWAGSPVPPPQAASGRVSGAISCGLIALFLILCPCQTTALDKERQVFRRRRHADVRSRYKAQPAPPELNSESEDYSPSSSETVRSPNSPF